MSPPAPAAGGGSAFSNSAAQTPRATSESGVGGDNNDDHSMNACAAAAAATLTPYTAARASFDTGAARRAGSSPRRNYTVDGLAEIDEQGSRNGAGGATTSSLAATATNDVENPPVARPNVAKDRLMEDVPAESRIVLEFRDLSCFVPRLFPASKDAGGSGGAGAGGALMRSATILGRSVTRRRRQPGSVVGGGVGGGGGGTESVVRVSTVKGGGGGAGGGSSSVATSSKPMRQVLFNITGCCLPGEVLALMGPSGSGKTSLLSILGGRTPKGATIAAGEGGGVLFNGEPLTKRAKRQLGFVLQDDLLYESLTVYETLYFAAMLRLPKTMTSAQKKARVDEVIAALGLSRCRDTIIGGFFRRGVSGGERKRVSVGHELLINPSVLLLDEPTSGLDSTTAMRLVTTLRSLAAGGRAVATTIHQPSSRLFQLLDKLLLLSEGHAIYYGRAALAADWFARLGYRMPYGVNAADFLLDVASGDVTASDEDGGGGGGKKDADEASPPLSGEASRLYLIEAYERFAALHGHRHDGFAASVDVSERGGSGAGAGGGEGSGYEAMMKAAAEERRRSLSASLSHEDNGPLAVGTMEAVDLDASSRSIGRPGSASAAAAANGSAAAAPANDNGNVGSAAALSSSLAKVKAARTAASLSGSGLGGSTKERKADRWGASYWTQISVLFARAVKTRRFETLSVQDFLQFIVVGLLSGLFWWQIGRNRTVAAAANANGLLFFEMLFLSFRSMFAALFTFPNEYKMMLKERASGMYRLSAFYFARSASDIPMEVTVPSVFIVIIYFMAGLRLEAWAFFANWAAVMLVLLVAQSFGLLIGATVMVPKTAQTITSVIMLTMMLVGGFYVTNIPAWIAWLKYLSFVYYGYNLLLKIEYSGVTLWSCRAEPGADGVAAGGAAGVVVPNPQSDPNCTPVPPGGLQAILHLQENTETWAWEAIALLGWLVVFRYAIYWALRRKTSSTARK